MPTIRRLGSAILLATVALVVFVRPLFAGDTLSLTVAPAKQEYELSDLVHINGSLMWVPHGIPVTDGLVGIEVRDSAGEPYIFRTRTTGNTTNQNWIVNFTQLYPCDSNAVPKYSFHRGESVFIFAEWKNFDKMQPHTLTVCFALYDANSVPIGVWYPFFGSVPPSSVSAVFFQSITISESMVTESATMYASLFSDFPKNGGYPYCPERAATFAVSTSQLASSTQHGRSALVLSSNAHALAAQYSDVTIDIIGEGSCVPAPGHYPKVYLIGDSLTFQVSAAAEWHFRGLTRNTVSWPSLTVPNLGAIEFFSVVFEENVVPPPPPPPPSNDSTLGFYDLSFRLPSNGVRSGYYRIYASTCYYDMVASNSAAFKLPGLVGDANGDGIIDIFDAIILSTAYGATPDKPNWNAAADLNGDNVVDIYDAIALASNYGKVT